MHDSALFEGFESGTLPANLFGHREHVRTAYLYLRRFGDFGQAAVRFREALRRFTELNGAPQKFHETLTWAYLALVQEAMDGFDDLTSDAFVARCPQLLDHRGGSLAGVYDLASLLTDERARRCVVLPRRA